MDRKSFIKLLGAGTLEALDGGLTRMEMITASAPQTVSLTRAWATELVALIAELNAGKFAEKDLKSPTHLKIGVAVNPNVEGQIEYLKKKIDAGAEFVQTQPIFDLAVAEKFLADVKKAGIKIPILLGREWWIFSLRDLDRYGFLSFTHETRTDWAMLMGAIFMLLSGSGRWSLDARLSQARPAGDSGN